MFSFPYTIFKKKLILVLLVLWWLPLFSAIAENNGESGRVLVNALNFRKRPSLNGAPIKKLHQGDNIIVLETKNGWLKIIHEGQLGYVKDNPDYVRIYATNETDLHFRKSPAPIEGLIKQSQTVNSQLEKSNTKLKSITSKEKEIFNSLDKIDSSMNQVRVKIRKIEKKIRVLSDRIEKSKVSASELEKKLKDHKDYADKRIVVLYKIHRLGGMAHVSSSKETMFDLIKQSNSFDRILKNDEDRLIKYAENARRLYILLDTQREQKGELEKLQSNLYRKQQKVSSEHKKRSELLSQLQEQRQFELSAQKMLAQASANLDKKITAITTNVFKASDSRRMAKDAFAHLKGLLNMPVKGKVISSFGTYKNPLNNATLYRSGVDIQADRGEPIRAVYSGKVLYAKWFKGFGNMIIIDHGDHYYSVYANIDELFKTMGDIVNKDEVIATVGDTGSLKGTKLYFEIRHYGKPQDPLSWIQIG